MKPRPPLRIRPHWSTVAALVVVACYSPPAALVLLAIVILWRLWMSALFDRQRGPPAPS